MLSLAVSWLERDLQTKIENVRYPEWALMISEAVNNAAKILDGEYYTLKAECIIESLTLGCQGGWSGDIFYLYHEKAGVACFHDPFYQIKGLDHLRWSKPWSGIWRQHDAFHILKDENVRRLYAYATVNGMTNSQVRKAMIRLGY